MSSTENLLKATLNRLTVRIGKKFVSTAAEFAVIAQDAPDKIKEEWELLKEEILKEAERLNTEETLEDADIWNESNARDASNAQSAIKKLRFKISHLTKKIEERS